MAILVKTSKPKTLLKRLEGAIGDEQIRTWSRDEDGDFTHIAEQWNKKAWLRARITEPGLIFRILPPKGQKISSVVYAVYHGRFIEMLLAHVDDLMESVEATSFPRHGDNVG